MTHKRGKTLGRLVGAVSAVAVMATTPLLAQDSWDYLEQELYRQDGSVNANANASANTGSTSAQTSANTSASVQGGQAAAEADFMTAMAGESALVAGAAGVGILVVVGGIAAAASDSDSRSTASGGTSTGTTTR